MTLTVSNLPCRPSSTISIKKTKNKSPRKTKDKTTNSSKNNQIDPMRVITGSRFSVK